MHKKYSLLVIAVALLAIVSVFVATNKTQAAGPPYALHGWAWSDNIGWVSFNSADTGIGSSYVVQASATGDLTGYAWSDSIGWIKFGGLSGYPGSGTVAHLDIATGNVTGWIRACAGTAAGDCSSMTSRTDGWDGWIELSGTNHPTGVTAGTAGVTFNGTNFVGYAWGSDVVGWLQFTPSLSLGGSVPVSCDSNCGIVAVTPVTISSCVPSPSGTLTGSSPWTVNWNPQASGGSPTVPGVYTFSPNPVVSYTTANAGPQSMIFTANDGNGHTSTAVTCGGVTVPTVSTPPATAPGITVKTRDASDPTSVLSSVTTISPGSPFAVSWTVPHVIGLTANCSATTISPATTFDGGWNAASWNSSIATGISAGTDTPTPTTVNTTSIVVPTSGSNTYLLKLSCSYSDGVSAPTTKTSTAILKISSSYRHE